MSRSSLGVAKIADAITETVLAAKNNLRESIGIYNDSTATLYVKLGSGVTTDDWTVALEQGDFYEPPALYTGVITGVWSADAGGQARVTEVY